MGGLRRGLYKAARILGDANTFSKGRVGRRVGRRIVGRIAGRGMGKAGCFVATTVYGDADCREVRALRRFRDEVLARSRLGRLFIAFYYGGGGQRMARLVRGRRWLVRAIRKGLDGVVVYQQTRRRGEPNRPSRSGLARNRLP